MRTAADGTTPAVESLDPAVIRTAIAECVCPWCGKGPFRSLVHHTGLMHGVERRQLCDMAEIKYTDKVCAPDLSEERRDQAIENNTADNIRHTGGSGPRTVSAAGRKALSANGKQTRAFPPHSATCVECGETYISVGQPQQDKYCSPQCCRKYRAKTADYLEARKCAHCQAEFQVHPWVKKRFCSRACGARHRQGSDERHAS